MLRGENVEGDIYLVKLSNQKVIPALCLKKLNENEIFIAQIRSATKMDHQIDQKELKLKNAKQIKNKKRKKKEIEKLNKLPNKKFIAIGQPKGLKDDSVVMLTKTFKVSISSIIKCIAVVDKKILEESINLYEGIKRNNKLHKELHLLKKKIQLAQFNNEDYRKYEDRLQKILKELDYENSKNIPNNKGYRNYREVPNEGYIKVYLGGR